MAKVVSRDREFVWVQEGDRFLAFPVDYPDGQAETLGAAKALEIDRAEKDQAGT